MNRAVYSYLLTTYGRRPAIWFGLVAETLRTLMVRVFGVFIYAQIPVHLATGDFNGTKFFILLSFLNGATAALIGAVGELVSLKSENKLYGRLEVEYFEKLTGKDMAFYRDSQSGYLVGLFRQYLDGQLELVRFFRVDLIRNLISLIFPPLILLYLNVNLGLVAIGVLAVQFVYISWSSSKLNALRVKSHEIYRRATAEVSDIITNVTAYKSSGAEKQARSRIRSLADEETSTFRERRSRMIKYDVPRDLVTTAGMSLAFLAVSTSHMSFGHAVGLAVITLSYMLQIVRNVSDLPNLLVRHDDLITKTAPTLEYLGKINETIRDPEHPELLKVTAGTIELDHVNFSYPDPAGKNREIPVFKDLNITIKGGEQVGIVGLSGAGKSTLTSLLLRFDDINSGAIRIDGTDIRTVNQSDLRRQIAYVPQEPLLFHRTIRENIAYFDDRASKKDIERAARAAHASEFISRLPDGYDSMVGERGVKLSGGQKQRVVIARAVLKNAPIMIFDEATSALDTESERIIQQALPEILGRHTALVIAHRLSTIAGLDRILVMQEGRIIEEGTHADLLEAGGRYAGLWRKQVHHLTPETVS